MIGVQELTEGKFPIHRLVKDTFGMPIKIPYFLE